MIELLTNIGMSEVWAYILSLGAPIVSVASTVIVALVAIFKVRRAVAEMKKTAELKELIEELRVQHSDNEALKRIQKKLCQEISRKIDLRCEDVEE